MGLVDTHPLSLKDARQITADLRKLYFSGTDPRTYFEEKVENSMTVAQCLDYWFDN
ncbi:integrase [Shigella flexneri 6603-63]|nr:integrase [Shigella flexneri 6603-63]